MARPFSKSFQKPERSHGTCTHSLPPSDLPCPWPALTSNHSTSAYSLLTQDTPLLAPSTMSSLCSDANSPRMPPLATFSNHSPHSWHALPSFSAKCFSIPAVPVTSLCSSPNCTFCVCVPRPAPGDDGAEMLAFSSPQHPHHEEWYPMRNRHSAKLLRKC